MRMHAPIGSFLSAANRDVGENLLLAAVPIATVNHHTILPIRTAAAASNGAVGTIVAAEFIIMSR